MKKVFFAALFLFTLVTNSFAEKITILYTGQTHAALYPCSCPKEPDGGVARRMAKVKELRLENPNTLLVDSGGFFAGGMFDEHSQGIELDKTRNEINLKALELMGYDALDIGDDELNFGKDYLLQKIRESKIPFLSANLRAAGAKAYVIKKFGNTSIALIGLTNDAAGPKSGGLEVEDAKSALVKTIQEAKKNKAHLILVLSYLGEDKDKELIAQVKDIDIFISGRPVNYTEAYTKIDSTILLHPSWQGRRLGRIDLELDNFKLKDFKADEIRLDSQIPPASEITEFLPECFADSDCQKNSLSGRCNNPAKSGASCSYDKPKQISLLVIQPKNIQILNQEQFIGSLKNVFPGLEPQFIDYDSTLGNSWVDRAGAKLLPVYLLAKEADRIGGFNRIKEFAELKGDYYYLKPQFSGGSFFVGRKKIPNKLDVFLGAQGENIEGILLLLKELQASHKGIEVNIHYLAVEGKNGFAAPGGRPELEEEVRQVCVSHYYPDKFWNYALCRVKAQGSSWWDVCAEQFGINTNTIKKCSLSDEGFSLLRENTRLNQELEIASGPAFLVNNYEIFGMRGVPRIETLEKMLGVEAEKK